MANGKAARKRRRKETAAYNPDVHIQAAVTMMHLGATHAQVAKGFDIAREVFSRWLEKYPDLKKAVIEAKDAYDSGVIEESLRKVAVGYTFTEKTYERHIPSDEEVLEGKYPDREPVMILTRKVRKHIPPSPRSIEYWLNNRAKDRWANKTEVDVNVMMSYESLLAELHTIRTETVMIEDFRGDGGTEERQGAIEET